MNKLCKITSRKQKHLILFIIICIALLFLLNRLASDIIPQIQEHYIKQNLPKSKNYHQRNNKLLNKSILYWDTFYGSENMGLGFGQEIFRNCPVSTCYTTNNRTSMPVEDFDAIIFHGARYSSALNGYPEKRSLHQKYIFFSLESPYNTKFDTLLNKDFYNWTMTYRKDSDIHFPYKLIQEMKTNYTIPDFEKFDKKNHMVAWFVSNCFTAGSQRRTKYVKELSRHISVHVYGNCGNYTCPKSRDCYKMIERDYKFYLSFENSMCADYVTEKLYNVLDYNIIPIVLGYADYNSLAPPKSVINVNDFDNPKALSQYLHELSDNYDDYIKYLDWKKYYTMTTSKEYVLCQLCELLNVPLEYTSYDDIENWFHGFKCFI